MVMIGLALFFAWIFFCTLLQPSKTKKEAHWVVQSLIFAVCGVMLYLYAVTEVLSALYKLSGKALFVGWILLIVLLIAATIGICRHRKENIPDHLKNIGKALRSRLSLFTVLMAAAAIAVLSISIFTVPYNWDSMTYHLPRIMTWAQNRSVAHYYTNDVRQISSPVLAEFINLHEYLLFHTDRLFNVLQGMSFLVSGLFVYQIMVLLNLEKRWRMVGMFLFLSIPIAFAEAFTTQVDNFATVWLLIFVYECVDLVNTEHLKDDPLLYVKLICTGLAGGFGYLTKPSVCVAMAVFAAGLLLIRILKKDSIKIIVLSLLITSVSGVLVIAPEIGRNLVTFHAIASKMTGARQLIGTLNPRYVLMNFVKNICFNLPNVYISSSAESINRFVTRVSHFLRVDLDHPAISEDGHPYVLYDPPEYGHDTAINPIVTWLFIVTTIIAIVLLIQYFRKRKIKGQITKAPSYYLLCSVFSFLAFMAVLRWERFETRYEISFLALLCPYIVYVISKAFQNRERFAHYAIAILSFVCIFSFVDQYDYHKKIMDKQTDSLRGYFINNMAAYEDYSKLIGEINSEGFESVSLFVMGGQYNYPFWPMCPAVKRIEDVDGDNTYNESRQYEDAGFVPDCIVWIDERPEGGTFTWHGANYVLRFETEIGYLLVRTDTKNTR